jgi:hypothetical protein
MIQGIQLEMLWVIVHFVIEYDWENVTKKFIPQDSRLCELQEEN